MNLLAGKKEGVNKPYAFLPDNDEIQEESNYTETQIFSDEKTE